MNTLLFFGLYTDRRYVDVTDHQKDVAYDTNRKENKKVFAISLTRGFTCKNHDEMKAVVIIANKLEDVIAEQQADFHDLFLFSLLHFFGLKRKILNVKYRHHLPSLREAVKKWTCDLQRKLNGTSC